MEINEQLITERIDKYIKENEKDILAEIDGRVAKAINKAIRDYFNNSYSNRNSEVSLYIKNKVKSIAEEQALIADVDVEEIARLVNKSINKQVKQISVRIGD